MLKKIGRFFEDHVEKIVLVIVGLVCVFLFIWRVLFSPNMVEITTPEGKTETLSPSVIDKRVYDNALLLNKMKTTSVSDVNTYEPKTADFLALLDSSIRDIDSNLTIPNPEIITPTKVARGQYNVPSSIGEVTDVAAGHIRAAAYVPTEPVTEQRSYDQVGHEPNDIDIVTVEGKFDIASVNKKFQETFVDLVEEQYADPCLARPVFASVNLQRQELTDDGTWSDWRNVPRSRIEQYKRLFENMQDGGNLPPGGIKVQMLQFDNKQVQLDLLQPQAYQFASAREEWFPPSLHDDYTTAVQKEINQERREERESERQERTRDTADRRSTRTGGGRLGGGFDGGTGADTGGRTTRGGRAGGGRRTNRTGDAGFTDGRTTGRGGTRRRGEAADLEMDRLMPGGLTTQIPPTTEVYQEFNQVRLNWTTDFSSLREPIMFWAFDDTIEPKKVYRYRIRLGVFNPVAESGKDDVIIWSEFSDITRPVEIPAKMYFYAKSIQETAKTLTITVCKYVLGYWRVEDFRGIGPGEAIGGVKEYEPEEPEEQPIMMGADRRIGMPAVVRPQERTEEPESIDFDTGAVLIDVVATNDWIASNDRNLNVKPYYDMLYSHAEADIEHMPVSLSNLPNNMRMEIARVTTLSRKEREPFKAFGSNRALQQRGPGIDGMRGEFDMYQEMMMMDGGRN
jgi:hypothetical protein